MVVDFPSKASLSRFYWVICCQTARLCLADEKRWETAWRIVPPKTFAVAIPHFQAVLLLTVLVPKCSMYIGTFKAANISDLLKVVWFSCIPVLVSDRLASSHPEKLALLSLIGARCPKMLVTHPCQEKRIASLILHKVESAFTISLDVLL